MRERLRHPVLLIMLVCTAFLIVPVAATAEDWVDALAAVVLDHQQFAKLEGREAAYEPYLAQLHVARLALHRGDVEGVYSAMNRFMDMLEYAPESAGIPLWSAQAIFDYCAEVTPPMYHDVSRHGAKKTAALGVERRTEQDKMVTG
ncbi:MAG TPA: hypothetical protein VFS39_05555 [Nitrospira sp.]|nr:hypothetical protein [Nitrospira sp.]